MGSVVGAGVGEDDVCCCVDLVGMVGVRSMCCVDAVGVVFVAGVVGVLTSWQ